jgi:hypothetical protein
MAVVLVQRGIVSVVPEPVTWAWTLAAEINSRAEINRTE